MTKPHGIADDLAVIRRLIVASLAIIVVIGAIFYTSSRSTDRRLEHAIRQMAVQRDAARVAVCRRDNAQSDAAVDYARGQAQVLIDTAWRGRTPSAEEQARAAGYIDAAGNAARAPFPKRSCTKTAIDAYYGDPAK